MNRTDGTHAFAAPLLVALYLPGCAQDGVGGALGEPASSTASTMGPSGGPTTTTPTTTEPTAAATTGAHTTATTSGSDAGSTSETGAAMTADTAASDATGGSVEDCGNAVIDPGEECDEGYAHNSDTGTCTLGCHHATCGDGLVWQGHELCDLGPDNNDTTYNGCTSACEFGPRCGDGLVQDAEECDHGDANGTGQTPNDGVACATMCRFDAKIVFVTSALYTGQQVDGVTGAHQHCEDLATAAALDNATNFKAFISASGFTPAEHFAHAKIPYVRVDGIRIADDWDDLIQNGPSPGISRDETGEIVEEWYVWSGTGPDGTMFIPERTCNGWTSEMPSDEGRVGRTGGGQWTSDTLLSCDFPARLYCFEQ